MPQITVRLSDELLKAIDGARDLVPRERWVRRVLGRELGLEVTEEVSRPAPAPRVSSAALDRQAKLNRAKGL